MHDIWWVKANGQHYKATSAVVTGIDQELPCFADIQNVYIADGKVLLEVKLYETISYLHQYHAYHLRTLQMVDINALIVPHPIIIRHVSHPTKLVAVLKYHICGTVSF